MHRLIIFLLVLTYVPMTSAAEISLDLEVPRLDVAEYHRPYIAIWIEREDASVAVQLAAWYMQDTPGKGGESGTQWLPDLRQWWRRGGRNLSLPVDGVTGATRPVGVHKLRFDDSGALRDLAVGQYQIVIEAAREVGGRELLKLPLAWPPTEATQASIQGAHELGRIVLQTSP